MRSHLNLALGDGAGGILLDRLPVVLGQVGISPVAHFRRCEGTRVILPRLCILTDRWCHQMKYYSDSEMSLGRLCNGRLTGLGKVSPRASPRAERSQELRNGPALSRSERQEQKQGGRRRGAGAHLPQCPSQDCSPVGRDSEITLHIVVLYRPVWCGCG